MNSDAKALKSGVWYTVSYVLARGVGYLAVPIFTRILSKEEFGVYNNYLSLLAVLTVIVTLNLASTMLNAKYDFADTFDDYIYAVLRLSTLSVAGWTIVFNVFWNFFEPYLGIGRTYFNIMMLYLLFLPAVDLYQAREKFSFEYKRNALSSICISVGNLFFPLVLFLVIENKLTAVILGTAMATIVMGGSLYIFFALGRKKIRKGYWKYALPICLPYIPHLLSLTVLNSTDKLMITFYCGEEKTALYSLAYNCGMVVTLLAIAINMAYGPWLAEKLANGEYKQIRVFSPKYIDGFFFCCIVIMLIAPEILLLLGGRPYMESKYDMLPVALGCICQFLYTMFVNVEQCKKKTVGMALASVSAALLNLILNYVFIPRFGYTAAAYTTLAGYLWLLLIHMVLVARLGYAGVYSYKKVLLTVVLGFAASGICAFLYSHTIVRYLALVSYVSVLTVMFGRKIKCKKNFLSDLLKSE